MLVGGLLAGVMYSLVAIGFVLIYKASGVFNFAQGSLVLFGALTFVSLVERHVAPWLAFVVTLAALALIAVAVERAVLRPLVNRTPIVLFMATLGLSFILEGAAQLFWGAQVHGLDLGIDDKPLELGRRDDQPVRPVRGGHGGRPRVRPVDDGPGARVSACHCVPSPMTRSPRWRSAYGFRAFWAIVWALAGFVSLVAGPAVGVRDWACSSLCRWSC